MSKQQTFEDFRPSYLALPEELNAVRTPEMVVEAAQVVGMVRYFVESGGEHAAQPQPIVRLNTTDRAQEARRDELVRRLALDWQVTLDQRLNGSEYRWKYELDQNGLPHEPTVPAWMKPFLQIEDDRPEADVTLPGVQRYALLTEKDGMEFFVHELEVEVGDRVNAIMVFSALPTYNRETISQDESAPADEPTPVVEVTADPDRPKPSRPAKRREPGAQPQVTNPVAVPGFNLFE